MKSVPAPRIAKSRQFWATREKVDAELLASVGQEHVKQARRTLAVLCDIGRQGAGEQHAEE
jgi:hypothetical protein